MDEIKIFGTTESSVVTSIFIHIHFLDAHLAISSIAISNMVVLSTLAFTIPIFILYLSSYLLHEYLSQNSSALDMVFLIEGFPPRLSAGDTHRMQIYMGVWGCRF